MRRKWLLAAALLVVIGGVALAAFAFPGRHGCLDGEGRVSRDIPIELCATPRSLLVMGADRPVPPRVGIVASTILASSVLLWLASRGSDPSSIDRG
jgi:hypothetical protein